MAELPPPVIVAPATLRRMFNDGRFWERVRSGEFRQFVRRDGHPSSPDAFEPFCTRSQFIYYLDANGEMVARVHQYLRRDGTLGGSGRPDPKELLVDGILYKTPNQRPSG